MFILHDDDVQPRRISTPDAVQVLKGEHQGVRTFARGQSHSHKRGARIREETHDEDQGLKLSGQEVAQDRLS